MSDKKIKILIMEPVSDMGGVSQYIVAVVRNLSKSRFDVGVGASGKGPVFDIFNDMGIRTIDLPIDYSTASFLKSVLKLRSFLKKEKFDILHAHTAKAGFICVFANWGLPAKIIYTGHSFRFEQKKSGIAKKIFYIFEKIICKRSNFVTTLSGSEREFGLKNKLLSSDRSKVVSMSIDVDKFLSYNKENSINIMERSGIPKNAFVVGMIGRITFQKDPETFIRAAEVVNRNNKNIYFYWLGDGDLKDEMVKTVNNLKLDKNVFFVGQQKSEDIPRWLAAMDAILFTSRFEGMPIGLLEAMAARKNIIAAKVGSIPDIIKNGVTGCTFEAGDFNNAASLVENIYNNRYDLSVGGNAFDLVKKSYSPASKISREFSEVYEKVLRS